MMPPLSTALIGRLESALDEEIRLLEARLGELEGLSKALVERDDESIEAFLERMERTEKAQAAADRELTGVRQIVANVVGRDAAELKLTRLVAELPRDQAPGVERRRKRIIELAGAVRRRHIETVMLLTECARITAMLLDRILPAGEAVVTYDADGSDLWRSSTGLLDAEL